jgi:hypothetical protein
MMCREAQQSMLLSRENLTRGASLRDFPFPSFGELWSATDEQQ